MADNDVRIKLSLDGDKAVANGLAGVSDASGETDSKLGSLISGGLAGAGLALAGLATAAVTAGAAMSGAVISSYADYEQNLGGIETMFKDSSDKMVAYADEAYLTAGLSANEYMSQVTSFSASLLQGLGGDTEAAADLANTAMVDMSDNANKFGTNIGDIQNAYQGFAKQNYTMLDNLKLGYGGTQEEMARLINDSGVLGDTMDVTAQTVNDVSFDKIIEAIHTVQDEMGIAGTTSLEASETISGSIGMLRGSFDNLLTGLGSADADVATLAGNVITSLETVVTNVGPVIENLGSNMSQLGPQIGGMIEGLVGTVSSAIPSLLDAGVAMIDGLISGVTSALPLLIEAAIPALVGLVEMIMTQLPLLLDAGIQAVVALATGIAEALPTLIPMFVQMVVDLVQTIVDNLPLVLDAALQLVVGLAEGLIAAIPVLLEALPQLISSLINFLIGSTPTVIQAGLDLFLALVGALPDIITGIVGALPQIITAVITAVLGAIPQLITGGLQLFLGLIGALPQIIKGLVGAIPQIIRALVTGFQASIPQIVAAGYQMISSLGRDVPRIAGEIGTKVGQIVNRIADAVRNGVGDMISAGGDLLAGLWQGISASAGWLRDKVLGWAGGLMDNVKDFFGIKSPSRKMRDQVGRQLPAGVGMGIEANEDAALTPMEDLNRRLTLEAKKLTGLNVQASVAMGSSQPLFSTATAMPTSYLPGNASVIQPNVSVDPNAIAQAFQQWATTNPGTVREVVVQNEIKMYDRNPNIVGSQIGRGIERELIG